MKSKLIVLAILSTLLLTGCSDGYTTPPYDEASLIDYRACVENYVAGGVDATTYLTAPAWAEKGSELCADLLHFNFSS